jgi:type II restriction/modification system DNA methylase subunit YeeA
METNALKKFAQAARTLLIDQVTNKLAVVLDPASIARREHPEAMKTLDDGIANQGKTQIVEMVAYTWFNRFTALRFMDVNGYTNPRVVSPADGATRPEILAEAMAGNLPDGVPATIAPLLDGRTPSRDAQGEAYRQLLVAACNQWHGPMPFLFEKIADYTELLMPEDLLSETSILASLRKAMTDDDCKDVEVIGWLYQFYISEKKDHVFAGLKKNVKITAENIPAATQLFTPHWIVRYLVENSLGRLWLLNRPGSNLAAQMDYYIAPEEPETDFLRIDRPEDIRICDPAAGSGHMLTYAFDLLHAIYEEEGYEPTEIPALILTYNLHGVEIDDRAGALAAFALVMKAAARLGRRRFLRLGVQPNICVMQDVRFTPAEMQDVATVVGRDLFTTELRETLVQFENAKNFGSLIVPKLRDPAEAARVVRLKDFSGDLMLRDLQKRVLKVMEMAESLSPKYHVVIANPPYMDISGANPELKAWATKVYPDSSANLFAIFMERGLSASLKGGLLAMINMQAWMFLSSFSQLRSKLISHQTLLTMAHLGENAFDSISGDVVSTTAFIFGNFKSKNKRSEFLRLVTGATEGEKAEHLSVGKLTRSPPFYYVAGADDFAKLPGAPISYWASQELRQTFLRSKQLREFASPRKGMVTADNTRFIRQWFEVESSKFARGIETREAAKTSRGKWFPYLKGGPFRRWYGNVEHVVNWENDGSELLNMKGNGYKVGSTNHNLEYIFKPALSWTKITTGLVSFRSTGHGFLFDDASGLCPIQDSSKQGQFAALLNSPVVYSSLGALNPTLNVNPGNLADVPVSLPTGTDKSAEKCIATARADWDANETSWDFTTLPLLQPDHRAETLAGTYTALRTHWQGMTDEMQRLEEENNRIFIDAYGLQEELTPDVPLEEITLTCNPAYRYGGNASPDELEARLRADTMAEFLHYAVGCMFGRYSLNAPGLILANQGEGMADYLARVPEPSFDVDADNVIPVLDGDWFADDVIGRFQKFLRITFGEANYQENLAFIESALGKDIRKWFTKDFFEYHVRRFKKRPIYWMFSSPKGSFNALIYMHRYRPDTASVVLNDYLREYISKLQSERVRLEKLADDQNASQAQRTKALKDVSTVIKQIDELEEWEREVAFPLAQAKLEIDLDDGVKSNYPKFGAALKPIKGLEASDE